MCTGKLQAIFCRFDKGERGQIPGHKASGRALYGRRAFVHCQLPLEWHAPIASVAALTAQPLAALPPYGCGVPLAGCERHAGPGFGGTIADRTHLVGGGVLDAPSRKAAVFAKACLLPCRVLRDCHVGLRPPRNDKSVCLTPPNYRLNTCNCLGRSLPVKGTPHP